MKSNIIHAINHVKNKSLGEIRERLLIELDNTLLTCGSYGYPKCLNEVMNHCRNVIEDYEEAYKHVEDKESVVYILKFHELYLQTLENIKTIWDNFSSYVYKI